jgi:hypothetical protein
VCVVLISVLIGKNGEMYERNAHLALRMEGLNLLDKLQDELTFASRFDNNLNTALSDPNAPSGGWIYNTTPKNTLIVGLPAIDKPRSDPSRQFVYYISGSHNGEIAVNNIIYYVSGTRLLRRVVVPNASIVSPTNYFKKTCPPGDTTANCQDDLELSNKVQAFTVLYYDANNVAVQTNPELADKVKMTLGMHDMANGNSVDETISITVKKYNDF